jgi:hypothetical protein
VVISRVALNHGERAQLEIMGNTIPAMFVAPFGFGWVD